MSLLQSQFHTLALLPDNATHGVPALSPRRGINLARNASSLRFRRYARDLRKQNQCRCYAAAFSPHTLQWVSSVSSAVLMVTKGTVIQKSFLVPLFVLQAPPTVISWVKGRYGTWTAFLALLIRLFYLIPGELELPFLTMLLAISAPYEAINLRGSQTGVIISLAVAVYLAFQHFSKLGSLQRAL
ncbi:hypothetical protein KSP40_PGU002778 [Platanthera guangdongensis]|uniref:Uncharacterized protein n=1 Tax=Platanthera guangdongensis TaxID=2320717 RepID=A0ABR2M2B9_9ASPA